VETCFSDLLAPSGDVAPTEFALVAEVGTDHLSLRLPDRVVPPQSPDGAAASLVTSVTRLALDEDPLRLHLHCAAMSSDGRGLLISASSGTGKTTLAAALARKGWSYLSDEMVALDGTSKCVSGFAKPMVIKPSGRELAGELELARVSFGLDEGLWWHIPAGAIPAPVTQEISPTLIVILHRTPDGSTYAPPVATPLHPADVVVALMEQTMDSQRFGSEAVFVLARLASRCRCIALSVGPLDLAVATLEELVIADVETVELQLPDEKATAVAELAGWAVGESVRSAVIGARAVVSNTAGGAVAAFDESGTALWQALHGCPPAWFEPAMSETPVAMAFLENLATHRLVTRTNKGTSS
jgi:hypothetical protein